MVFNLPTFQNLTEIIILSLLLFFCLVKLFYHLYFFRIVKKDKDTQSSHNQPVSIVVCARNEKENLIKLLPILFEQNYPNFEVIICNDGSWDGTSDWLDEQLKIYSKLKVVSLTEEMKRDRKGKKFALSLGIKAAQNEILLLTDADCVPISKNWIKEMVAPYSDPKIEIVLGHSPFINQKSILSCFNIFENTLTAMFYFSFAKRKMPYMGVGRNLSYKRSLFFKLKGFASHHHVIGGDDDLFVQEAANKENTAVVLNKDSYVNTHHKSSFKEWIYQKNRHLNTSKYYQIKFQFWLGWFNFNHILLFATSVLSFVLLPQLYLFLISFLLFFWIIKFIILYPSFDLLSHKNWIYLLPIMDFLYVIYLFLMGYYSVFKTQKKW